MSQEGNVTMEKIVSLCKRRGFVFQGSEIYGGLRGTWDLGPLGVLLNNNIKREWWKMFVESREDMYGLDAAILMNEKVWEASGHTGAGFSDPLVECEKCKRRFRADHLENKEVCSECGGKLGEERDFNLMFETKVGAQGDVKSYLRPETAQGIFVNFKNVVDSMSPKIPFGIAQIGKAFRNEIAPREFLFRVREFEQMEIEYFVKEEDWKEKFEALRADIQKWHAHIGLSSENIKEHEVPENDLAHYSKRTIDFEYNYPGKGFDELAGFAYRTDHDLKNHMEASGVSLEYVEPDGNKFIPHVLEPSFGVGRAFTAVLAEAYTEDEMGGETRTLLRLPAYLAPYRVAVSPLLKNKPELVEKARNAFSDLKKEFGNVAWDDNGNIGKRYRRQDEIGTPYCVTIDFDTIEKDDTVTVRDRDTGEQVRVAVGDLVNYFREKFNS
ncbi:MAG: glycine--tRNA ligase [Candidatus Zambryskibacteria bacterium CG10_big_fil_rev_8_21_14_0_10_42_12]|uniref:glycine--tRNA ligase n=1 Tax=Candidatus Zambryskibacteria bacterium CG10_big_fil_rev_8_21_14_0_10_42_12 TaxID=1975115 RepID=A0A2H0QWZ5_9BACT|nr:MAG: glycine--tRNA ligase [Candidatus Zambryskibacteria bacterium CG10_big_fil_rev_8_21_14_0_10_42_12]